MSNPILSRKRKTLDPCPTCFLHRERCICDYIPKLNLQTRVSLIIHAKELKRTTNTGRLAVHALSNSEMIIRGQDHHPLDLSHLLSPDYESYVLYPSEDAIDLEQLKPTKPIQLIVSDGNWRQAGKLNTRHPELSHLPRVKISGGNMALYHMRKEHFKEGLSTLEAIALALGAIEGPDVGERLMSLYRAKLGATLIGRGVDFCGVNPYAEIE
jgi:DTW domain-containing protein YfiP